MPSWPVTLPQEFQRSGFQRAPKASNVIAFGTEVGPGKTRRRSTARTKSHTGTVPGLTLAQVAIFESFFENDLADGALTFTWSDPVAGGTATWRFDTEGAYSLDEVAKDNWSLSISIVRMP